MRQWKIRLEAEEPFLIGKHRIVDNHYETLDYIPATVLQAAVARAILESHSDYDVYTHGKKKRFFIDPNHPHITVDGCRPVWKNWFTYFNDLCFNDSTPFGAARYTPTTLKCKAFSEHPIVETLAIRYKDRKDAKYTHLTCAECGNDNLDGRLERKDGWNFPDDRRVIKRMVTRIEIDAKRLVGRDARLYTMAIGEPISGIEEGRGIPLYFESILFAPEDVDLTVEEETIRVGSYVTTGLGKMKLTVLPHEPMSINEIDEQLRKWNEAVERKEPEPYSIAIQLLSDVYVPLWIIEECKVKKYMKTEEYHNLYTRWFHKDMDVPEDIKVGYSYFQQEQRRGISYDSNEFRQEALSTVILNGSVVVLQGEEKSLRTWLEYTIQNGLKIHNQNRAQRIPIKIIAGS